jgi:streptogramin lyase
MVAAVLASTASANAVFSYDHSVGEGQIGQIDAITFDSSGNLWVTGFKALTPEEGVQVWEFNEKGELMRQLHVPTVMDIKVDSKGNIWVCNNAYHKIQKFNSEGKEIGSFGEYGSGNGQLKSPTRFAIASSGNFWVLDKGNNRVEEFNAEGKYVSQFKIPSDVAAEGIAIDATGNFWITDWSKKNRIVKLNSKGEYLAQVGEGYLNLPRGDAAFDSEGHLWVADWGADRLAAFDPAHPSDPPMQTLGEAGTGPGQFSGAVSVAVDKMNDVWAGDWTSLEKGRVQKWSAAPAVITEAASGMTTSEATLNGSVNPHGLETTYQFEYGTGSGYGKVAPASPNSIGKGTEFLKASPKVTGLEANTIYHFRIKATNSHGTTYGEDKWFNAGTHEWGMQATPEQAESTSSYLKSVSCTASETCVALGYSLGGPSAGLLAKVETAGKWSLSTPAKPGGAFYYGLGDISCATANACTAVGGTSPGSGYAPLAERWNGSSWSIQSTPAPAEAKWSYLWGVTCLASNDCIAVGSAGASETAHLTLVERWNGTSWSIVSTPNPEGTKAELRSVSCVSANDCWAVGNSKGTAALAEHWNGTAWSINSPTLTPSLTDVSCASSSSCVATSSGATVVRWNGTSWSTETPPAPAGAKVVSLSHISCTSASACVATGSYTDANWVVRPLAESWNGSKWSVQSTSAPLAVENAKEEEEGEARLNGDVSCTSATACTAVGTSWTPALGTRSLVNVRH